ncbi:hypothetical protein [Saccharibacillus alkalitolerans]|uniref:Uncharacterized protein n=1 Tax=Saccharibacillus alkalitolerans TaxID=2705290 RepID=A0ABX0F2B0_9BACL|nr:hypothetical protein [Saccharibacillus alkalitolerans]NGZ75128.1 hypothetical protein [Saccharibacillus alkalitolerans]
MSLAAVPFPALPSSAGRITAIHPLPHRTALASDELSAPVGAAASAASAAPCPLAEPNAESAELCELLAVNDRAELLQVSPLRGGIRILSALNIPEFDPLKPIQIVVDAYGRYAAVSNRYGRYAAVYALPEGPIEKTAELLTLDRGSYYTDKSRFPLAFAELEKRTLLIHGSDWNRVELTELPSLRPLAERAFPGRDEAGEASETAEADSPTLPELNYFHGGLLTSPDGSRIADTGWVWQPVGLLAAWSLREWLDDPWASENGESLKHFFQTEDWDMPAAWIDNERLAAWGRVDTDILDEEDYQEIGSEPVIAIHDARTGSVSLVARDVPPYLRSTAFVPSSECFPYPLGGMAAAENRLFFWGRGVPLHIWALPQVGAVSADLADSRPETAVESAASNSAARALPDSAPHPVTEIEFHDAVYHPEAKLFIDLQADGRMQAFRLSDADASSREN